MFKKSMTVLLIGTQLMNAAFAATSKDQGSAEQTFLSNIYALQGLKLSDAQQRSQMNTLVSDYTSQSAGESDEVRTENLREALVSLNILTKSDAEQLVQAAQESGDQLTQANHDELNKRFADQVTALVANQPSGAQFSRCHDTTKEVGAVLALGGLAGIFVAGFALPSYTQISGAPDGFTQVNHERSEAMWGSAAVMVIGAILLGHSGC